MVSLVERVGEQARGVRVAAFAGRVVRAAGRVVASVLVAPLWAVAWLTFWLCVGVGAALRAAGAAVVAVLRGVGLVLRYVAAAVKLGWLDARRQAQRRDVGVGHWPVAPWVRKPGPAGGAG
jgi:hypothetical protein